MRTNIRLADASDLLFAVALASGASAPGSMAPTARVSAAR
jgi:hypothetical protein